MQCSQIEDPCISSVALFSKSQLFTKLSSIVRSFPSIVFQNILFCISFDSEHSSVFSRLGTSGTLVTTPEFTATVDRSQQAWVLARKRSVRTRFEMTRVGRGPKPLLQLLLKRICRRVPFYIFEKKKFLVVYFICTETISCKAVAKQKYN